MADETPQTDPSSAEENAAAPEVNPAEEAVQSVEDAAQAVQAAVGATVPDGPMDLPDLSNGSAPVEEDPTGMNLLNDVSLRVKIELGRTLMFVEDVLKLNTDSVIELDKAAGDPVDIYVNERHVARGEVLVLNENFCVRISEIINATGIED